MSNNALVRELLVGFSYGKQTDVDTAALVANVWRLNKLDATVLTPDQVREDDAAEIGKAHEFATATYKSHVNIGPYSMSKYLSSEILAWAAAFGLGNTVVTGTAPYTYTCTPLNKVANGLELPYFTYIEQIRASTFWDNMFPGCALDGFEVDVVTAPGRASSRISLSFAGTGKITTPSGYTLPAKTTEHELPGSSLALTIIGNNYVTLKDIVSLKWGWRNNLKPRYYPGSGNQDGFAKAGALEVGDRQAVLSAVVRVRDGGDEYSKLIAGTTGTAVITQTFSTNETYTATYQQVALNALRTTDDDGKFALELVISPQYHATNGILTVVAKTAFGGICQ